MIQQVRHCSHTTITHRLHRCTIHVIHLVSFASNQSLYSPHQIRSSMPYPSDSVDSPPNQIYSPVPYPPTYTPHQFCSPVPFPPTYPPQQFRLPVPYTSDPSNSPQQPPSAINSYKVCFKVGNISVCNGCRKRFTEQDQVVIQHAEDRYYTNPQTGLPASKYGNAYYHPLKYTFMQSKWGAAFNQGNLVIPDAVKDKLTLSQKNHLYQFSCSDFF